MNTKYSSIVWGLATIGMLVTVNELDNFNNYLNLQPFLIKFGLIGLALAVIVVIWLRRKISVSNKTGKKNWSIITLISIGIVSLTISLGSKLNRHFFNEHPRCDNFGVIVKDFEKRHRSKRFFIQATSANELKEITVKQEDWENINPNQEITICDYKGFFGYEFSKLKD